jgi:hypothetical protein
MVALPKHLVDKIKPGRFNYPEDCKQQCWEAYKGSAAERLHKMAHPVDISNRGLVYTSSLLTSVVSGTIPPSICDHVTTVQNDWIRGKQVAKEVRCEHCDRKFTTTNGLGGHMSRKHQGMSVKHAFKIAKRKTRVLHRMANKSAKATMAKWNCEGWSKDKKARVSWALARAIRDGV